MTTTDLIKLLQSVEKGASGRSREITIYKQDQNGKLEEVILTENQKIEIFSTGDGIAGSELSLVVKQEPVILATERDKKVFFDTVENPREPNEALKEAYKKRTDFFEDDELDNNQ